MPTLSRDSSVTKATPDGHVCATGAEQVSAPDLSAAELEGDIEYARLKMTRARTHEAQRIWFECMRNLIGMRSPEQIAKLEEDRGLTRP